MRPRAKYAVIYRHRNEYPVPVMCRFFQVSRSGCYDFVRRIGRPEPDAGLGELLKEQQLHVRQTYGYRRMWLWLESQGIYRNPKTVPRIMKKITLWRRSVGPESGLIWDSKSTSMKIFSIGTFTRKDRTPNGSRTSHTSTRVKVFSIYP